MGKVLSQYTKIAIDVSGKVSFFPYSDMEKLSTRWMNITIDVWRFSHTKIWRKYQPGI